MPVQSVGPSSREVARVAGVSQATVSAVLNKSRYVSPELVERVRAAIAQLGYRPNAAARALKTGRSGVIGMVVPSIVSPYWSAFVRSVGRVATERDLSLILAESDEDDAGERSRLAMLLERQIDGVLVVPRSTANREFIVQAGGRVPVVLVDNHLDAGTLDSVAIDVEDGTRAATAHLLGHGARRIGLVLFPQARIGTRAFLAGYAAALAAAGVAYDDRLVRYAGFSEIDGYYATQQLLGRFERNARPDALLVVNHLMAIGALHAAADAGLRVPEDVRLIGFDDTPWAAWLTPPLSLVDDPREELGARAVGALLRRLQRPDAPPRRDVLRTRLVLRRSCGCAYDPVQAAQQAAQAALEAGKDQP